MADPTQISFFTEFMPHGHCYAWMPSILWSTVIADGVIAASYFSIPIALLIYIRTKKSFRFSWLGAMFASFILLCGLTHLFSIYTIWFGEYGIHAVIKGFTAIVSLLTAVILFRILPVALQLPTLEEYKHALSIADQARMQQIKLRIAAEEQEKVRSQLERLDRVLNTINDGIWEWEVSTGRAWFSSKMYELIKLNNPEKDESNNYHFWFNHIHPDDRERVTAALDSHLKQGTPFNITYKGLTNTNQYEWLHSRGAIVKQEQNQKIYMAGLLSNVNESKTTALKLQEKSQFLDSVLSNILSAVYIFDLNQLKFTYINPEFTTLTGYSLELINTTIESHSVEVLYHPDDFAKLHETNRSLGRKQDNIQEQQFRFRHQKGQWIWCHGQEIPYESMGQTDKILGTFFDITQIKAQEQQLEVVAYNYKNVFEQLAVGIAKVSLHHEIEEANQKLGEILLTAPEELKGCNLNDMTHPDDLDISLQQESSLFDGMLDSFTVEKRLKGSDDQFKWALLTYAMQKNQSNIPHEFLVVVQDISDRKKAEQMLEESNQALERFAYAASHDLQEPLRKICSFSDRLEKRLSEKDLDEASEYELGRISSAATRMSKMITSLLNLSRITNTNLIRQKINLISIINDVKDTLALNLKESNATIKVESDVSLMVDPQAFQQLFQNLINNAIHYSRESIPPVITISFGKTRENLPEIKVRDNGIGIPKEYTESIFAPFKRHAVENHDGQGMGLAICQQIVKAHGGIIRANPSPTDQGAEFIMKFQPDIVAKVSAA